MNNEITTLFLLFQTIITKQYFNHNTILSNYNHDTILNLFLFFHFFIILTKKRKINTLYIFIIIVVRLFFDKLIVVRLKRFHMAQKIVVLLVTRQFFFPFQCRHIYYNSLLIHLQACTTHQHNNCYSMLTFDAYSFDMPGLILILICFGIIRRNLAFL